MKNNSEYLNLLKVNPKQLGPVFLHGTKYYIGWDQKNKTTAYFNWKTNKIFNHDDRPPNCPKCKKAFIKDPDPKNNYWFDPCIGKLPGVKTACCGHGVCEGYISFQNNKVIRFSPKNVTVESHKPYISNDGLFGVKIKKLNEK